jgi:ketosteroid isomerase-like protein
VPDETPWAVSTYFRCLDAEDWETMEEIWTEDARLRAVGARVREGRDEVVGYYRKLFDPWIEHHDTPTRVIVAGDVVTVEVTFSGRTRTGREASFDAVDVFDLRDGRICALSNWYDLVAARRAVAE